MKFSDLNLKSDLLFGNIAKIGFTDTTPIQAAVIPLALEGKDISGLSRTGTGKTFAFLIPMIDGLLAGAKDTIALCLAPTRELALQIEQETKKLLNGSGINPVSTVGGMPIAQQIKAIRNNGRLVVGTPGRVIDLMKSGIFATDKIAMLVFDEADRMFDMGFIDDMRFILNRINQERQILLFSATMNFSVLDLMYEYNCDPVEINISKDKLTADGITQFVYHVSDFEKPKALIQLCSQAKDGSIIIFVNYREKVLWVTDILNANGIPATGISSLLRQDKRNRILDEFKKGKFRALVATDVASRGLDIDDVSLVVNYHLPEEAANYVHRIGRTARAGRSGIAVAIAGPEDGYNQLRIEEFLGSKIPVKWFEEKELSPDNIKIKLDRDDNMNNSRNRTSIRISGRAGERAGERTTGRREQGGNKRGSNRRSNSRNSKKEGRTRDGSEYSRSNQPSNDNKNRRHSQNSDSQEKRKPPYPITGNPTVYCTVTGKPKNSPTNTPTAIVGDYSNEKRVNILQKIGSTVSSIFAKK